VIIVAAIVATALASAAGSASAASRMSWPVLARDRCGSFPFCAFGGLTAMPDGSAAVVACVEDPSSSPDAQGYRDGRPVILKVGVKGRVTTFAEGFKGQVEVAFLPSFPGAKPVFFAKRAVRLTLSPTKPEASGFR
jgi:hypothetical protein